MSKKLYILRHGETEFNKNGIVQGRGVDSDLNDQGRLQAEAFYNRYRGLKFDKIYTSSLKRTHQTVHKFIASGIPWEQLSGLDEFSWGDWEGKTTSAESILDFRILQQKWNSGNYEAKAKGGECPAEVSIRLQEVINHIKSNEDEQMVLICMHGRALRLLMCLLMRKPFWAMSTFPHKNTTLYKVSLIGDEFSIKSYNNTDHLMKLPLG